MKNFYLEATTNTPEVNFNPSTGELNISGRSVISDAESFYAPILNWLDDYSKEPAKTTVLNINMQSFNIASSKRILFILYKLNEMNQDGINCAVNWMYSESEDEMFEVGQDYAFMVKVPFQFVSVEKSLGLLA